MEFQDLVPVLAESDWQRAAEAERVLVDAGEAGMAAVLEGMRSPDALIRRACVRFMDHHGTDRSIPALLEALQDSVPRVRREAVHSLACNRCKESPLCLDTVSILISVLENEPNAKVRAEAVHGLGLQKPDSRAIPILRRILAEESPHLIRRGAYLALKHHDPEYRRQIDEGARADSQARHANSAG